MFSQNTQRHTHLLLVTLLCALPFCNPRTAAAEPKNADWEQMASNGKGFLVWESNRSGRWRIWTRQLDGSGLQQLTPDEKGRDHFCPHISPDGKTVLYLSYPETGAYKEPPRQEVVPMYAIQPNGRNNRKIIDDAISARIGNRGAVWLNNDRFVYIDRDGQSRVYSMTTGKSTRALTRNGKYHLLSPLLDYACDRYHFHPFDRVTKTIQKTGSRLGGCESYFTHNGRWGFRMNGTGGPIARVDLATSQLHNLLEKHDKRMPKDRGYVYFPMISSCQRLLTFGASPDQHDHFTSDYEIFVATIDPETLEIRNKPVRYTFDSKTDRYPDAYLEPLDLGAHSGEAPIDITFTNPQINSSKPNTWTWDYGDGQQGNSAAHRYDAPGHYAVVARKGRTTLRGAVTVREPKAPQITLATLRDPGTLWLRFDEAVNADDATLTLASGIAITSPQLSEDGLQLLATLASPLLADDQLHVSGIRDRAESPNIMPATTLAMTTLRWPVETSSCAWAWQTQKKKLPAAFQGRVDARGTARYTHNRSMDTFGGAFKALEANEDLLAALVDSGEMTIELTLNSDNAMQNGPARIVSFSENATSGNFTLSQRKGDLVFQMRTSENTNVSTPIPLMQVPANRATHVAITYASGQLTAYHDGEQVTQTNAFNGTFSNWEPMNLIIGSEWDGTLGWHGSVEGIAIYDKALSSDLIRKSAVAYQSLRTERAQVKTHKVKARLLSRSTRPTLVEIAPYQEALSLHEFEVTESTSAELPVGKRFRGAAWVWRNAKTPPIVNSPIDSDISMTLTRFGDNPQLKSIYLADTLDFDVDVEVYYLVRP
jgi:hypothetical protein